MSRKTPSMPVGAGSLVVAVVALASLPALAASTGPFRAVDRDSPSSYWIEDRSWGGGARFVFDLKQSLAADAAHRDFLAGTEFATNVRPPSLKFLAGGGPEFTFGCTDRDPAKSYWRFRVGVTPPGSGITSRDEIAYEKGIKYYFGAPGTLILLGEADKEIRRIPLAPSNDALETAALTQDDVQAILNAPVIRAKTPRIFFESGTSALKATIGGNAKLPCAAR
ncbi:hypothetical protein [Methylocystis iwaonis]|uniref:hypothetical protein n=1 Tax=Methylocystis iwaonis TaxID=2885079 RepID=UPI002E7C0BC0|nr:hypothetical protein [Methylocystis iwaonis]